MFDLFVVMLSHVTVDTFKIFFLAMHFFIPYFAAFWIVFGAYGIEGYTLKYGDIFYNLFEMIVVGDYNFDGLKQHSQIMSRLLCGTFIFFSGINCLNLFIGLMSDTFQRVYDNAKANAVMQRAATVVNLETDLTTSRLIMYRDWVNTNCAPECLYFDDDVSDPHNNTLARLTHQIHEKLSTVKEYLEEYVINKSSGKLGDSLHSHHHQSTNINDRSIQEHLTKIENVIRKFQKDYQRSLIQTRAEIAGLGIILKELMEKQTKEKK